MIFYETFDPFNQGNQSTTGNISDSASGIYSQGASQGSAMPLINPSMNPFVQSPQALQQAQQAQLGTRGQVATLQQGGAAQQLANQIAMEKLKQQQLSLQQDQFVNQGRQMLGSDAVGYSTVGSGQPTVYGPNVSDPLANKSPEAYRAAMVANQLNMQQLGEQGQMSQLQLQQKLQPLQTQMNNPYLQQAMQIKQSQDKDAATTIQKLISTGSLKYDPNSGMPMVQVDAPGGGGLKMWQTVDNPDPTKQLPYNLAAQILNPQARLLAGESNTPQTQAASNVLYLRQQGYSPQVANNPAGQRLAEYLKRGVPYDQALEYLKMDSQNGGQAATAGDIQKVQPASGVQPQNVQQQAEIDSQAISSAVNSVSSKITDAANTGANFIQEMKARAQNIAPYWANQGIRGINAIRRWQNPNTPIIPNQPYVNPYGNQ